MFLLISLAYCLNLLVCKECHREKQFLVGKITDLVILNKYLEGAITELQLLFAIIPEVIAKFLLLGCFF